MKNLYQAATVEEVKQRIERLKPDSQRQWGKMNVAQAVAHCSGPMEWADRFAAAGPKGCTTHPHTFFGRLTPEEWATLMYKHLDHHLRQFGV